MSAAPTTRSRWSGSVAKVRLRVGQRIEWGFRGTTYSGTITHFHKDGCPRIDKSGVGPDEHAVITVLDAALPVLLDGIDREELAAAIDPAAFDDGVPKSKRDVAQIQWAVRRKWATDAADAVLAHLRTVWGEQA